MTRNKTAFSISRGSAMPPSDSYTRLAQTYVNGVRELFTLPSQPTGERGGRGPSSPEELVEKAEELESVSASLVQAASAQLEDPDPTIRTQISESLLAKALTDLEISAYLLQAAEDAASGKVWTSGEGVERDAVGLGDIEEQLQIILRVGEIPGTMAERGETTIQDIPTARLKLSQAIEDSLALILKQASKTGQSALNALLGLGMTEVAKAAGLVGMNIAEALGQAEIVSRLYNAFRSFALRAYESLLSLLGKQLAEAAAKKMLEWLDDVKNGQLFSEVLERLYQTQQTAQKLTSLANSSEVNLNQFLAAIQGLNKLDGAYSKQVNLTEKIIKMLSFLSLIPAAVMPQAKLLLAASYLVLGSYIILIGGDYADAQRLQRIDRLPGVSRTVESSLATNG